MALSHFNKEVYIARRKRLKELVGTGLIVLMGNEESSMNYKDNCYPFRQDSSFLYYIGLDLPGLIAIIDIDNDKEILFGENFSIDDIVWMGPQPTIAELAFTVGIAQSDGLTKVENYITRSSGTAIHILPPYRPENKIRLSSLLNTRLQEVDKMVSTKLIKAVIAQREVKEEIEIEEMERAVNISADMHDSVMKTATAGMKEYELAALAESVALKSWGRLSYPIILTINGQTLHNHYHGNTLADGRMLLIDAGAETTLRYAGDLTRTIPVAKTFNTQQKELYQTVLNALTTSERLLKPGTAFRDIHAAASLELLKGLKAIGLVKGNVEDAFAADTHTLFFQCGLGHMIGLDVHDMEDLGENHVGYGEDFIRNMVFGWKSLRLAKTLKAGFTVTVEPGIYIIPELIDRWKAERKNSDFVNYELLGSFRDFGGIRIEDNYVITAENSRKLGKHLARTVDEVEAVRG